MWFRYEELLAHYYNCFLHHCLSEHKIKTVLEYIPSKYTDILSTTGVDLDKVDKDSLPFWFADSDFNMSHRARLIEKKRDFYLPKFPEAEGFNGGKYLWPVMETKTYRII